MVYGSYIIFCKNHACISTNIIGGLSSTLDEEEAVNNETRGDHHCVHRVGDGVGERANHGWSKAVELVAKE